MADTIAEHVKRRIQYWKKEEVDFRNRQYRILQNLHDQYGHELVDRFLNEPVDSETAAKIAHHGLTGE